MLRTTINVARRSAVQARVVKPHTSPVTAVATQKFYSSGSIHDNDPEVLEKEKQRNLKGEQHHTSTPHKHAPGWNEYLASTSEAYTKADKSDTPIHLLQTETVEYTTKRHPPGMLEKAGETVVEKVQAVVEEVKEAASETKDTIMGPLAGAGKKAGKASKKPGRTGSEEAVKADRGDV